MYETSTQRTARHEEEIRRLKLRPTGQGIGRFTVEHTFIVGGEWNSATVIPPMMLNVNVGPYSADDGSGDPRWESKAIVDYAWKTRTGSVTGMGFKFWPQTSAEPTTPTPSGSLPIPITIDALSFLRPFPEGAGQDLSIGIWIEHRPGVKDFTP